MTIPMAKTSEYSPNDVFQIVENNREGFIGAFILAEDVYPWGIQGYIAHVVDGERQDRIYVRAKWDQIKFIGNTDSE